MAKTAAPIDNRVVMRGLLGCARFSLKRCPTPGGAKLKSERQRMKEGVETIYSRQSRFARILPVESRRSRSDRKT